MKGYNNNNDIIDKYNQDDNDDHIKNKSKITTKQSKKESKISTPKKNKLNKDNSH
jgi:hypothetical protein